MLKVMIAEDNLMIADALSETLTEHGYEVCGIASTVAQAVALGLKSRPDLAVIDVRLADGGLGTDIALRLKSEFPLGILYATGNVSNIPLKRSHGEASISKPYRDESVLRALEIVAGMANGGAADPPFPRGFNVLTFAPTPGGAIPHA